MNASVEENKPRIVVDLTQMLAEVPSRLARIEVRLDHLEQNLSGLKSDFKDLRTELRWLLGIMLTGFLGLAGLLLHGH